MIQEQNLENILQDSKWTINEAVDNLENLFMQSKNVYLQNNDTFYVSRESIAGFNMAELPIRDKYIFSTYSIGDDDDVKKLRDLDPGNFKTFSCDLCPIQEPDNAVIVSDDQNQLTLNNDIPSIKINHKFKGVHTIPNNNTKLDYIITGTVPQYYYNHLLLVSDNHIPTFALFLDFRVFSDTMYFLQLATANNPNLFAYFNGNFGSVVHHYHVHLSNQTNTFIEKILSQNINEGRTLIEYNNIFAYTVLYYKDTDPVRLFTNIREDFFTFLEILKNDSNTIICGNLCFRNGSFHVILNFVKKDMLNFDYNDCFYRIFPASYLLYLRTPCNNLPTNSIKYDELKQAILWHYRQVYIKPSNYNKLEPYGPRQRLNFSNKIIQMSNQFDTDFSSFYKDNQIEMIYGVIENKLLSNSISENTAEMFLNFVNNLPCLNLDKPCSINELGKFIYFLGLGVRYSSNGLLNEEKYSNLRILSQLKIFRDYEIVSSDYLYFRGNFVQNLIVKTINNLIRITGLDTPVAINNELNTVNNWINFVFNRIGEDSKSGANTVSNIRNSNIDFVMKIIATSIQRKQFEFIHEFFTSSIINEIRKYIPNFILCYGGFFCNSNDATVSLCNNLGDSYSYLLLENIKNSRTLGRRLRIPMIRYQDEIEDTYDILYQLVVSLDFAWKTKKFTHYDLHLDNIMEYDFISNKNYLSNFKFYSEIMGDRLPIIDKALFRYYLDKNDENRYLLVPVKYLYIIIDYGLTYVEGMPQGTSFALPSRIENAGMTSDRPNILSDIYTLMMSFFHNILMYKPYLLFDDKGDYYPDNPLLSIFHKTLTFYGKLYNVSADQIFNNIQYLNRDNSQINNYKKYEEYFKSITKREYKSSFKYLHKDFLQNADSLKNENFYGAGRVAQWMFENHYRNKDLITYLSNPTTIVFNWGFVPDGVLQGPQPPKEVYSIIENNKNKKREEINKIKLVNTIKKSMR